MTIMESIDFSYAGKRSVDYGIYNVTIDGGMFDESFIANRSIQETKVRGNDKPYFHGVQYEPLTFQLSFAFKNTWDDDLIREIARWLSQDYYKPLFFTENVDRIFYCMVIDDTRLVHNGLKQGYVKLTMRCDSPYTYSPTMTAGWFDFSDLPADQYANMDFSNDGDVVLKPEIWITKVGAGDVSIKNVTNKGIEFKFTGLANGETIYVDNEREYIESSLESQNIYRYNNFNNNFLKLLGYSNNVLHISGACRINFRYQFRTLQ